MAKRKSGIRDRVKELRRVRAGDLKPNPLNWRIHSQTQRDALQGILAEVGYADALIARKVPGGGLELLDGHLRADLDPNQKVPVLVVDLNDAEAKKLLTTLDPLAAMAETNVAQLETLLREIETEQPAVQAMLDRMAVENKIELLPADPVDPEPQIDRAAELQKEWGTATGQVWEIPGKAGVHRVMCGDSTKAEDVGRLMGGAKAGLVLADPPYGINHPTNYAQRGRGKLAGCRDYGKPVWNNPHSNNFPTIVGDDQLFDPAAILLLGVPSILWGGNYFASRLPDSGGWLVWDKDRPDDLDQATCELAWTNCVKGVRRFRYLWNGMMKAGEHGENYHPTQKPVALMHWVLSLAWIPDGICFDPYMGSGPVLIAAENLSRVCYGMEISPAYIAVVCQRAKDAGMSPRLVANKPSSKS